MITIWACSHQYWTCYTFYIRLYYSLQHKNVVRGEQVLVVSESSWCLRRWRSVDLLFCFSLTAIIRPSVGHSSSGSSTFTLKIVFFFKLNYIFTAALKGTWYILTRSVSGVYPWRPKTISLMILKLPAAPFKHTIRLRSWNGERYEEIVLTNATTSSDGQTSENESKAVC